MPVESRTRAAVRTKASPAVRGRSANSAAASARAQAMCFLKDSARNRITQPCAIVRLRGFQQSERFYGDTGSLPLAASLDEKPESILLIGRGATGDLAARDPQLGKAIGSAADCPCDSRCTHLS